MKKNWTIIYTEDHTFGCRILDFLYNKFKITLHNSLILHQLIYVFIKSKNYKNFCKFFNFKNKILKKWNKKI